MKEMVGGCCVCSDERGWDENPLVYCDGNGCTVAVHQACYGIVTVPKGPWFCRKCESQERAARVRCELCPQKEGALKRTDTGGWCHVVCALFIPEAWFGNVQTMEPIILKGIPPERYNKSCYICEEQDREGKANTGGCMQCNKSGCRFHFHVTCAQAQGLLCEEAGNLSDSVKYCGYCSSHYRKVKKDSNVKVIPPYRHVATESDSQEKEKNPLIRGEKPKLRIVTSQSHLVQSTGSSPALTTSKAESKERAHSKSSLNSSSDSSTADAISPAFRNTPTTTSSCAPGAKNVLGKFTTANFIETTISSSPANFGNVNEKEKKGKAVTTANLTTLPENLISSNFSTNSEALESKGARSGLAAASKSSDRKVGKAADSKLMANFKVLEGTSKVSDIDDKGIKAAEVRNGRLSPDVAEKSAVTGSHPSSLFTATSKSAFSHSFANFLNENAPSIQRPPPGSTSTETYDSELSDTPINNKRTIEQEPKEKRRYKKQRVERNVAKGKTVKDLLSPPPPTSSASSVASQKAFSPTLSVGSVPVAGGTNVKRPTEATFPKFYASGLVDRSSEYSNNLSSGSFKPGAASSGIDSANNGDIVSSSQRICPPPLPAAISSSANHLSSNLEENDPSRFPTSMEELLHRQWIQGSQFLMEQGQMLDIASLLNCLHDLRQENQRLEERIGVLTTRRDNLLAVNARLSVPFSPPNNTHRSTATPHGIDGTSPEHPGVNRHVNRSPRVNNCLPGDQALRDAETVFGGPGPASRFGPSSAVSGLLNRSPVQTSSGNQRLNQSRFAHSGGSQSAVAVMQPGGGLLQQSPPRLTGVTGSLPLPTSLVGFPSSLTGGAVSRVDMALFAEQLQRQQFLQSNPPLQEQSRQLLYQLQQQAQLLAPSSASITASGSTSLSHQRTLPVVHSLAGDLLPGTALQSPLQSGGSGGRASDSKSHQNKADDKS